MAKKQHKGMFEFSGDESGNIALGQLGFKELSGSENTGDGNFVAFKVLGGSATNTAVISATCHQGDDLGSTTMVTGEIVWGAFKKVTTGVLGAGTKVLVYYGK